jgi:hypothetical protein
MELQRLIVVLSTPYDVGVMKHEVRNLLPIVFLTFYIGHLGKIDEVKLGTRKFHRAKELKDCGALEALREEKTKMIPFAV